MMQLKVNGNKYVFTRENGEVVEFNHLEIAFLAFEFRKMEWIVELECEIDSNIDNLDFSQMSREEFLEDCLETLKFRWECNTIGNNSIDYQEIVVDEAEDSGIWRDEE
jgi:hypothetical protein